MLKINKQSITLTKGDDASLRLVPRYKDKTIYTVQEGDSAIFRLKVGASVKELECVINLENNKIVVNFTPADTKDFEPGIYRYEAELITSLGFHYTFIADQPFILGNEIEQRLSNATSANGNSNGNYPEIDGEIGDEPVVNGDIQPTNPMMDYDELNHLPKLNNVTIKGSHDNAYYGIPTKTSDLDNDSDFVSDDEYVHTDNNYDDTDKGKVDALGTASTYDVAESGNASTSQVVKGDDTRLMDARTPVAHQHSKVDITDFPTNVSAFNNDSGYITNAVNTLINYYLKSETYTKTEVEQLIAAIKQGKFEVVETLPTNPDPNVIYLVPKDSTQTSNAYDEYVYINNAWEKIGDTDIDLSDYVTDEELTTALQNYVTTSDLQTAIANYYTKTETDNLLSNKVDKVSGKGLSTNDYDNTAKGIVDGVTTALADKVDKINGKGLSTEDYTTAEKTKLAAISDEANKVTSSSTNGHINIDGVDTTVYDDTVVTTAISGLNENVEDIQDELSTDTSTVEGNPINFSTKSAQTAQSTIIDLEPIQDLHGYGYPWIGGAGKNLYVGSPSFDGYNNISLWTKESETYNGHDVYSNTSNWRGLNKAITLGAGIYTFSCTAKSSTSGTKMYFYGLGSSVLREVSLTTSWVKYSISITLNEETTVSLRVETNSETAQALYVTEYQIEVGSQATSYEPYENICTITGRTQDNILGCGKNRFNPTNTTLTGFTYSNGVFSNSQTDTKDYFQMGVQLRKNNVAVYNSSNISISATGRYDIIYSYSGEYDTLRIRHNGSVRDLYIEYPYAIQGRHILSLYVDANNPSTVGGLQISKIQLEKTEDAEPSAYEPYTLSNDITISFGDTVFGARHDVGRGLLVVDKAIVDLGSCEWEKVSTRFKSTSINTIAKRTLSDSTIPDAKCSHYEVVSPLTTLNTDFTISIGTDASIWVKDTNYTDATTFKTAMNSVQLCYELATPITINLTPHTINLLKGVNNISTDGDKITLTYRDGKVATLGDLTSAVDNLDSKIDESQILTDTVTGDKYILVVTNGVLSVEQVSN